jgi:hypothetical protein
VISGTLADRNFNHPNANFESLQSKTTMLLTVIVVRLRLL